MTDSLAANPLAHALGLALVHFVWQGTLLGLAGTLALLAMRRASAHLRYLTACLTLVVMCGTLAVTFADYARAFARLPSADLGPALSAAQTQVSTTETAATTTAVSVSGAGSWIEAQWPLIVMVWAVGVLFCALRFLRAWMLVQRVRRGARPATGWTERIAAMRTAMGVTNRLRIFESALVDVPSVIGWLRPLILVPASALAGLSPSQFDAVLAHELAHVRRHDYFINMLQSVVEILLFYHPAVWSISRQIRREREHCCDDVAVKVCGDRVAYAAALASLEELRAGTPSLAMGAKSGELLARVRRLISPRPAPDRRVSGWIPLGVALITISMVTLAQDRSAATGKQVESLPSSETAATIALPELPPSEPAISPTTTVQVQPAPPRDPVPAPQATLGSIRGAIIDAQGGRLPGATITARTEAGNAAYTAITTGSGLYQIAGLVPGVYDVSVSMPGFRTSVSRIQAGASETRLNVRLELGGVTETITVRRATASAVPTPGDPRGPNDFLDLARQYYESGRFAEATAMTSRALELMRAQVSVQPVEVNLDPNGPVRVGGDIRHPTKIRDVKPVYPAEVEAANVRGIVIIEAVIAKDGTVKNARVLRSVPALNESALEAVRQWLFTPTLLNGVPVEVIMTVTVNFSEP